MTFAREYDLPWEVRRSVAGELPPFFPKVFGKNVKAASGATFSLHDPAGTSIQSGTATVTHLGTPEISAISIAVNPIAVLGERYQARITWSLFGETDSHQDVQQFDVVLYEFGNPIVAMNQLSEDRPETIEELDLYGQRLGYEAGDQATTNAAALCAMRAHLKLISWIRAGVAVDASSSSETRAPIRRTRSYATRPALILNRDSLGLVERHLALEHLYNATADNPLDGEGKTDKLAQFHRREAQEAWARITLDYDLSEDLVADTTVEGGNRVTFVRRAQA